MQLENELTIDQKLSTPTPLKLCKLLVVDMTSYIVKSEVNIETEFVCGKLSKILIILETSCIWQAKVGPTFI